MEGTYPLMIDGEAVGEVRVYAEGGWTVFDARSRALPGIVRVSVYGAGREGYLGVLAPEGDSLCLRRRLSRSALRDFPAQIEYAGRAGEATPVGRDDPGAPPVGRDDPGAPDPETETPPEECETPTEECETPPDIEDVYWYASPDGALVCFDGEQNLIALPFGDERVPAHVRGWPKTIEGREYVVYRTKDGRIVR